MTMTSRTIVELIFLELWNTYSMDVRTFREVVALLHCVREGVPTQLRSGSVAEYHLTFF